jgi:hypothetical protein
MKLNSLFTIKGNNEKIILKSMDLKSKKRNAVPAIRDASPIRFKTIALSAALVAESLLFQKLINKKEHTPIPSQPKNKIKKLSLNTKTNIKKVNKDKREKKRTKLESCDI